MTHRMKTRSLLLAALVLLVVPARAFVIDQSTLLPQPGMPLGAIGGYLVSPGYRVAQSFEAGVTGTLSQIDVQFGFLSFDTPVTPLAFSLVRLNSDGLPSDEVIAASFIDAPSETNVFTNYTLSMDFSGQMVGIEAGVDYALICESLDLTSSWGYWVDSVDDGVNYYTGDRYSRGSGLYQVANGDWQNIDLVYPEIAFDLAFATYVTPVPVPPAVLLFGSAVFFLTRLKT